MEEAYRLNTQELTFHSKPPTLPGLYRNVFPSFRRTWRAWEMPTGSEIAARTGVNYVSAKIHLEALESGDISVRVTFGKSLETLQYQTRPRILSKFAQARES